MIEILKKSERKKILKILEERFGFEDLRDFYLLKMGKNRVRIIHKDFDKVNLEGMRVRFLGLEFCILTKKEEVRLTIEGSQIIGRKAKKNVLLVNEEAAKEWMNGKTPVIKGKNVEEGFVIVKWKDDILGCGRYAKNKLWSFVPKWRRVSIF